MMRKVTEIYGNSRACAARTLCINFVRRVGCMHGENLRNPVRARRAGAIRWFLTNQVDSFYDRCIASTLPSF
jgi:hypothetical protein